jgi:ketosteroid isomerase-like protein
VTPGERQSAEELLERLLELFNERDWEAFEALVHPDFEFDSVIHSTFRGPASKGARYRGLAGLREWLEDIIDAFDDFRFQSLEVRPLGPDAVFELSRLTGRGRGSGIAVEYDFVRIAQFTDGLLRRIRTYADIDEGRRAAAELGNAPGEVPGA